jgi:hypothetical protein
MTGFDHQLRHRLYRALCPESATLGDYRLGMLASASEKEVEHHLQSCRHCRAELAMLASFLDELAPEIDLTPGERIQIWIAKLLPKPGLAAAAMGLRGVGDSDPLRYELGQGGALTLEAQDDPSTPGRRALLGLLTGLPPDSQPQPMRATLWHAGGEPDRHPAARGDVDPYGNLILEDLSPGRYDLLLSGGSFEIHVQDVEV